jgi:hypothetical protein
MAERDLVIDNDQDNVMYDPNAGFTIIDYQTKEYRKNNEPVDAASQVGWMGRSGGMLGDEGATTSHLQKLRDAARQKFGDAKAADIESAWKRKA